MLVENILIALTSLKANKLRSVLTMLGIIIGIGAVIAISTIGDAISGFVNEQMKMYGAGNVQYFIKPKAEDINFTLGFSSEEEQDTEEIENRREITDADLINMDMIQSFERDFADRIYATSIEETVEQQLVLRNQNAKSTVHLIGVNTGYCKFNKLKMLAGSFLEEADIELKTINAVVSDKFVKEYFDNKLTAEQALNQTIETVIQRQFITFRIAGVYEQKKDGEESKSPTTNFLIPYTTAFRYMHRPTLFGTYSATPRDNVDAIQFQIDSTTYFASYYEKNDTYTVSSFALSSIIKSQNEVMKKLKLAIGGIAAISLLVGGIGIMNIMMVSVTERTREIGVRMALGAKSGTIRMQFIIESIFVSGIGGMIGIVLGFLLGNLGAKLMNLSAHPSISSAIIAVTFSMAIGIFFGYYPANKAANLDPIEALRYE